MTGFIPERPSHDVEQASVTSAWHPLRNAVYRSLWIAAIFANIGAWMHEVAATWLMAGMAPSPLYVSLLQTATSLPMFLLALPGGALADIVSRRFLLLFTFAGLILAITTAGLLALGGWLNPWLLLSITFLIGVGNGFARPALDALTPEVVTHADMPQAVSLDALGLNVARALGGTLAGLLMARLGPGALFLLNAACVLPYGIALLKWKPEARPRTLPPESIMQATRAGLRYLRFAPALRSVVIRIAAFIFAGSALWSLLPLIARGEMKVGPAEYGLLVGFFGTGALAGAWLLPAVTSRVRPNSLLTAATILLAGVLFSIAFVRSYAVMAGIMIAAGLSWLALMSSLNGAVQGSVPGWVRARASALSSLTFMGGMTAGSALWGLIATVGSVPFALVSAAGAGLAGACLGVRYRLPERSVDYAPSLHWPKPELEGASNEAGPVEVTVEYRIDPARAGVFDQEIRRLGDVRKRDGATDWRLDVDPADPSHYIEIFTLPSWTDHLRQHERVTVADRQLEDAVRAFHAGRTPPVVTHRPAKR
jgi:MFS family permease